MATMNMDISAAIGGLVILGKISESGGGQIGEEFSLPAAKAGTLTTRTDNDTGVATLAEGHGIITSDVVDVYWSGGRRYGMTATVSGNAVTVDGGAGDNLPAAQTALTVAKQVAAEFYFAGDDVQAAIVATDYRAGASFIDESGNVQALDLAAGKAWLWADSLGTTNPFAGKDVIGAKLSCGDSTSAAAMKIGVIHANT